MLMLGFADSAADIANAFIEKERSFDREVKEADVLLENKLGYREFHVGMSNVRFQLKHTGPIMIRNVESAPDPRVTSFYPDKWQRRLLDVVDAKESALIVAPTSSGKTFISFYCMKKILLNNKISGLKRDKGIVVYVCPTKALCRQVCADVYQRYGPVYGQFTMDYNQKVLESDVIVTVPSCFEYLMLCPAHESLVHRIQYVIFDEVHCIGQTHMDGRVWERLLLANRAPILALSATVGNPDPFFNWLADAERMKGREIHLIVHKARWSDLEKYVYLPREVDPSRRCVFDDIHRFRTLAEHQGIVSINPCVALSPGLGLDSFDVKEGFPRDLAFSPSDALSLYSAMVRYADRLLPAEMKQRLAALDPDRCLSNSPRQYIDKTIAQNYVQTLKDELTYWNNNGLVAASQAVFSGLSSTVQNRIDITENVHHAEHKDPYNADFLSKHFLAFCLELYSNDRLPAVVFCLNEGLCETLLNNVLNELEARDEAVNQSPEALEKKAERNKLRLERLRQKQRAESRTKSGNDEHNNAAEEPEDFGDLAEEDENAVDPHFSFLRETEHMNSVDLEYWLGRVLYKTGWRRDHPFIRALFRGIGIHHPALKMHYRQLVETLFRGKHLKIVISTETLAMGINMPCRTVCFAGDYRLTPLLYQQMAGRAGRRGFDDVGHVVFFGVPPRTAFRLVKSPLAHLQGYFVVNTALVLRIMQHYSGVTNKKWALDTFRTLLECPFNASLDPEQKQVIVDQARFHFRFSCHFLYEKGLLDSDGNAKGMANLINHMPQDDCAVYPFVTLLESGLLDRVCANFNRDKPGVAKNVVAILAHFFERVPLPANFNADAVRQNDLKDTVSQVMLSDMPEEVKAIVDEHNRTTLDCFSNYVRVFSNFLETKNPSFARSSCTLPLSKETFPPQHQREPLITEPDTIINTLFEEAKAVSAHGRSPFIALSAPRADYGSLEEIADTVNSSLYFPTHVEPVVATRDLMFQEVRLNAYAIDVFSHRKVQRLMTVNNLDDAKIFTVLKNWSKIMQQLCADIVILMNLEERPNKTPVYNTFKYIGEVFLELLGNFIKLGFQHGEVY
jgi:hypothetical protein